MDCPYEQTYLSSKSWNRTVVYARAKCAHIARAQIFALKRTVDSSRAARAKYAQIPRAEIFDQKRANFGEIYVFSYEEHDALKIKIAKLYYVLEIKRLLK